MLILGSRQREGGRLALVLAFETSKSSPNDTSPSTKPPQLILFKQSIWEQNIQVYVSMGVILIQTIKIFLGSNGQIVIH